MRHLFLVCCLSAVLFSCNKQETQVQEVQPKPGLQGKHYIVKGLKIVIDFITSPGSWSYTITNGGPKQYYCEGWWGICKGGICIPKDDSKLENKSYYFEDPIRCVKGVSLPYSIKSHFRGDSIVISTDIPIYDGTFIKAKTYQVLHDTEYEDYILLE